MIKGMCLTLTPNVKTLLWKSTKNDTMIGLKACITGVRIGGADLTFDNGCKILSQKCYDFKMANNDEIYAIFDSKVMMNILVQG